MIPGWFSVAGDFERDARKKYFLPENTAGSNTPE
jgi:hypothetical protein